MALEQEIKKRYSLQHRGGENGSGWSWVETKTVAQSVAGDCRFPVVSNTWCTFLAFFFFFFCMETHPLLTLVFIYEKEKKRTHTHSLWLDVIMQSSTCNSCLTGSLQNHMKSSSSVYLLYGGHTSLLTLQYFQEDNVLATEIFQGCKEADWPSVAELSFGSGDLDLDEMALGFTSRSIRAVSPSLTAISILPFLFLSIYLIVYSGVAGALQYMWHVLCKWM